MTEPLVVVDADVLGRRRTGDETYMRNLLRELGSLAGASGLRIAAVDSASRARARRHRAARAADAAPGDADAPNAAAAAPPHGRSARAHAVRRSGSLAVPGGGHDPRSLVRARLRAHGAEGPARLPPRRPAGRAGGAPRADGLRAHARRSRSALRPSRGEGRRDPERRRPRVRAREQPEPRHVRPRRRGGAAAQEPPGGTRCRGGGPAARLSSPAP